MPVILASSAAFVKAMLIQLPGRHVLGGFEWQMRLLVIKTQILAKIRRKYACTVTEIT